MSLDEQNERRIEDTSKHAQNRANRSPEEHARDKAKNQKRMRSVRQNTLHKEKQPNCKQKRSSADDGSVDSYDLGAYIKRAVKIAKKHLHRTKMPDNPRAHQCYVCIVCDRVILGTESLRVMREDRLKEHSHRLGVHEYEQYHGIELPKILKKQYRVRGYPNMLLSRRERRIRKEWTTCAECKSAMKKRCITKFTPPKNAIANGFAIGQMPKKLKDKMAKRSKLTQKRFRTN